MSLKARILRHSTAPDRTHHECASAAASLSAAYEATIARLQHTIDVQTAWIDRQAQQIAILKDLAGLAPNALIAPVGGWTPQDKARSRELDALTQRLEAGTDGLLVRVWLQLRKRRLERAVFGGAK